jgi:hypothetical protein
MQGLELEAVVRAGQGDAVGHERFLWGCAQFATAGVPE